MSGYGDMAQGMGFMQTAYNLGAAQMQKKPNRLIQRKEDTVRDRNESFQQNEMALGQQDVNRDFDRTARNADASDVHNTGRSSSIRPENQNLIEDERKRRYDTIQRRRDLEGSNFQDESEIIRAKRQIQKMQDMMALVNGGINGGAQGAAQSYTQRQY